MMERQDETDEEVSQVGTFWSPYLRIGPGKEESETEDAEKGSSGHAEKTECQLDK